MSLEKLSELDFKEKVLNNKGYSVVKFTADWCYPVK